jgi:hypothetical protein
VCGGRVLTIDLGRTRVNIPEKSSGQQVHRGFVESENRDLVVLEIPRTILTVDPGRTRVSVWEVLGFLPSDIWGV